MFDVLVFLWWGLGVNCICANPIKASVNVCGSSCQHEQRIIYPDFSAKYNLHYPPKREEHVDQNGIIPTSNALVYPIEYNPEPDYIGNHLNSGQERFPYPKAVPDLENYSLDNAKYSDLPAGVLHGNYDRGGMAHTKLTESHHAHDLAMYLQMLPADDLLFRGIALNQNKRKIPPVYVSVGGIDKGTNSLYGLNGGYHQINPYYPIPHPNAIKNLPGKVGGVPWYLTPQQTRPNTQIPGNMNEYMPIGAFGKRVNEIIRELTGYGHIHKKIEKFLQHFSGKDQPTKHIPQTYDMLFGGLDGEISYNDIFDHKQFAGFGHG